MMMNDFASVVKPDASIFGIPPPDKKLSNLLLLLRFEAVLMTISRDVL